MAAEERVVSQQSHYVPPGAVVGRARLERIERLRQVDAWSAEGAVGGFAALRAAGFEPVGEAFGASVLHPGSVKQVGGLCSVWRTDVVDDPGDSLLRELYGARRVVLERAVAECRALGGDGIVGARLRVVRHPAQGTQFTVEGTAVRARSRVRPPDPFTTHVSIPDFVRLLGAGWMPFAVVFGLGFGTRHDDWGTVVQTRRAVGIAGNQEVDTYTHLVNDMRRVARRQLEAAALRRGGQGVAIEEMTLRIGERECPSREREHDHTAEVSLLGSALVALPRRKRDTGRSALTIMHLNDDPASAWQAPRPLG